MISLKDEPGALERPSSVCDPWNQPEQDRVAAESEESVGLPLFIDFIGHHSDASVQGALQELGDHCEFVKWLGSYPNVARDA